MIALVAQLRKSAAFQIDDFADQLRAGHFAAAGWSWLTCWR
jgi:hypothetical protein